MGKLDKSGTIPKEKKHQGETERFRALQSVRGGKGYHRKSAPSWGEKRKRVMEETPIKYGLKNTDKVAT